MYIKNFFFYLNELDLQRPFHTCISPTYHSIKKVAHCIFIIILVALTPPVVERANALSTVKKMSKHAKMRNPQGRGGCSTKSPDFD